MAHMYSENASYWANSEAKRSSHRGVTKALGTKDQKSDTEAGLGRIEPVRLTFDSPSASQKSPAVRRAALLEKEPCHDLQSIDGEAPAEELPTDNTPTASLLDGVQTPDHPEELTGQPGAKLQAQEGVASPLQSTGAAPDVGEAELADVALVWRECQNGRTARSRARTSVTSLYSSGAMEALLEDIKGQRASADLQLAAARQEKAAADELASKAGYEGFCIQGQLLHSLESAVDRAAAAHSDKEQLRVDLRSALAEIAATQEQQHHLAQQLQAEQSVRVAAEQALQASRDEVQALGAKARRAEKRRKRLQATMEGFTEAAQQPILTHGQSLAASRGAWPGQIGGAAAEALLSFYTDLPGNAPDSGTPVPIKDMQSVSPSQPATRAQRSPPTSVSERQGIREVYRTPMSRLQRAGSAAVSPGSCSTSERRQLQREANAEALALEYEQSAGSGYEEEADLHLTPSRLLLRLREARAAAASAASGARRARAAASAAEMGQATAEAAEQRIGAALLAAEQRRHALDEHCRRLQAKLGRTEVDLAQLRSQNEGALRDVALKAGAIRDLRAECDSSRAMSEDVQRQVAAVREEAVTELSKHIKQAQRLEELREADAELLASQKAELAQLHTRQTELQLAAVEREAAAQDLYVRLEAAQGDLCGERERGDQAAAQLAAAQQQLQDVEGRLEESKAEFEASQGALEAAEEALREQAADTARLEGALESKTSEVAEFGERHKELAAEAQVLQAETCRMEAALLAEQLRTTELTRELEGGCAEQERLREACACAENSLEALQAEKTDLMLRWQAMDGRTDRSVQEAEARLADVQTELMASQYDAHLAGEALRSSQEHLSDLSFNMEDGENRLAEMQAHFAHLEEQVAAADALRAEAEARCADLAEQVAEEQARSRKLAEKLAAARSASSSAPAHAQLASADEAKRRAEQHAENMRQKLLLLRKDTAAREAQLREEAAAARGEAEAAAQLVHALQPKGDFVLGTLWTKLMEAHARATRLPHKLSASPPVGPPQPEDTLDSPEEGAQKQHLVEIWAQLEAARGDAEEQKRQLATAQAKLAAGGLRGQKPQLEAPAASSADAAGHELQCETAFSAAYPMSPPTEEPSNSDALRHCAYDSQSEPVSQQPAPPSAREGGGSGEGDSGNSSGGGTPSEDSPPSAPEQSRPGGAQESPIRGLIIPESPADSRAIAESMLRLLREDSPMCEGFGGNWEFSPGAGSPHSLPDEASRLQRQPLDDVNDSASSSGPPREADSAECAPESDLAEEQTGAVAEDVAPLPASESSSSAFIDRECSIDHAIQESSTELDKAAASLPSSAEVTDAAGTDFARHDSESPSSLPDEAMVAATASASSSRSEAEGHFSLPNGAHMADTAGESNSPHEAEGQGSCSGAPEPLLDALAPISEPPAALRPHAVVPSISAWRRLLKLRIRAVHKQLLGGGVVLIALAAAVRRRSGVLQLLRFLFRAFALYGETMQRLR